MPPRGSWNTGRSYTARKRARVRIYLLLSRFPWGRALRIRPRSLLLDAMTQHLLR